MSRLLERDTSTQSDLKRRATTTDPRAYLQMRDLYISGVDIGSSKDEPEYYGHPYDPEYQPSFVTLASASSSSIDADPNPLSILLLDDVSMRLATFIGTLTRKLADRDALLAETDLLDWDAAIEAAPSRPKRTISVSIKYVGRSRPIPVDDSWE